MIKFSGIRRQSDNTTVIDGYTTAKTVKGAISDVGRFIASHVDKGEGEAILHNPNEALQPESTSCGGYFFELEEVEDACQLNEETEEIESAEGSFYFWVRLSI